MRTKIQYRIMARTPDGREFQCFTWTRDAQSGVERAKQNAAQFKVEVEEVWAVPVKVAA